MRCFHSSCGLLRGDQHSGEAEARLGWHDPLQGQGHLLETHPGLFCILRTWTLDICHCYWTQYEGEVGDN